MPSETRFVGEKKQTQRCGRQTGEGWHRARAEKGTGTLGGRGEQQEQLKDGAEGGVGVAA